MRKIAFALIPVAVVAILLLLVKFLFYPGGYEPPPYEKLRYEDITATAPPAQPFVDHYETRIGTLVLDRAHDNDFVPWELNVLLSRIMSRGFAFEYLSPESQGEKKAETAAKRLERMKKKFRYADTLAVILPREALPPKELELIRDFVRKGGKLLLIGDPTRPSEINSVSSELGLIFEADYLYNLKEYDGNYQHIFVTEFATADKITKDLTKIALYSAGSISSTNKGIAFTDENTLSSVILTKGKLSPLVLAEEAKVLAIADLTFMREPFNAAWDNNQLISNIADWLTTSHRVFVLSDFPYFLKDGIVIAYADPAVIDIGLELKSFLSERGKSVELVQYKDMSTVSQDMVFIGSFKEADKVGKYLERGKISVTVEAEGGNEGESAEKPPPAEAEKPTEITITTVEIDSFGQVYREEGTSILYLDRQEDRDVLIILSDGEETLKDTIRILRSGEFRHWLVSDKLGIYYPPKPQGEGPAR